ncbi:MAG TPA: hypothetical protein PK890_12260, partial [Terrimesophilobacter sp.]|nr:hypothetical protein [Terrimesophilobacter sp.]
MATHFLRLRLAAARNIHRRRPAALLGLLFATTALAAATIVAINLLGAAANAEPTPGTPPALATTAILIGSAITALPATLKVPVIPRLVEVVVAQTED